MTQIKQRTDALPDADYEIAQRVLDTLAVRSTRTYSPSEIARLANLTTDQVHRVLPALVADEHLSTTDQRSRSRYKFVWG